MTSHGAENSSSTRPSSAAPSTPGSCPPSSKVSWRRWTKARSPGPTPSYARDIRVVIYDGKMHPVDSNEISFKLAARNAFKEAFRNAGPKIMEPIYNVEVLVPSEYMGAVMSDLQNRRAMIAGMESDKGFDRLNALVPLAELYRYSTTLSSLTSGSATYTMKFSSYEQVPADVQDKLLKAYTDTDEE